MGRAKEFVLGRPEPEPQGWLSIFNCLPGERSYTYAVIAFALAGFWLFLSVILLGIIVIAPSKFVMCFTLAMISTLVAMAFLNGPRLYVKRLFQEKNLVASAILLISIVMSLWFSMIEQSYIMSVIFCLVQLNAILYYFCNMSATSMATFRWICDGLRRSILGIFTSGTV